MEKDISIFVKGAVHKLQLYLLDGLNSEDQLFAAGSLISQRDYRDVVTERSIVNICGYPLCKNTLPLEPTHKGRYRISLKEHKVYDLHETSMYCSDRCLVNSRAFCESLYEERCAVTNPSKIINILNVFVDLIDDARAVHNNEEDLELSRLKIQEKSGKAVGDVSLEQWAGPSNAIEGYVPQKDLSQIEMNFRSMIIPTDDLSVSSAPNPLKCSTTVTDEKSARNQSTSSNQSSEKLRKSSLKAPDSKKSGRSVSWIDQTRDKTKEALHEIKNISVSVAKGSNSLENIAKSEGFTPENSWYDFPPEGFNLTLSPFSIMWDTLFRWITSSSLAFIYERDEEDVMFINGREYPTKYCLSDGRSSEIKQTISGFLSRAFPVLVSDLKLSLPVSSIEKSMDQLLNTMSFVDALPGLRTKQWHVIALLFLEALSVCKLPALYFKHNTCFVQNNVLNGSKIKLDEYEVLRDLVLPLGAVPCQ